MTRLIDATNCPHCGAELPQPKPRVCPTCGGSIQQRYLRVGCLSSAPPLFLLSAAAWHLIDLALR